MQFIRLGCNVLKISSFHTQLRHFITKTNIQINPQKAATLQLRELHKSRHRKKSPTPSGANPKLPDLLYFPHILRWLKSKLRFKYLQKTWDPEFSEGAFIYGTTHAVCRITEIINENNVQDLKNLVTPQVEKRLKEDMNSKFTNLQKEMIRLKPEDIKLLVPLKVRFDTENGKKICSVLLKSLSLKWYEYSKSLKLVLIVLETEFKRDYGLPNNISEWTISNFDVMQCSVLTSTPQ